MIHILVLKPLLLFNMKVILLMAQTLDGKIAEDSDHFPDWTGKADKKFFMERTKRAGVMIMGNSTYKTIGRPLPGRKTVVMTRSPKESEYDNLEFTDSQPTEIIQKLEEDGFQEVILAGGTQVNTLFAEANLIDEMLITVSPLYFGSGLGLFSNHTQMDMELKSCESLDSQVILLHYSVKKTV